MVRGRLGSVMVRGRLGSVMVRGRLGSVMVRGREEEWFRRNAIITYIYVRTYIPKFKHICFIDSKLCNFNLEKKLA